MHLTRYIIAAGLVCAALDASAHGPSFTDSVLVTKGGELASGCGSATGNPRDFCNLTEELNAIKAGLAAADGDLSETSVSDLGDVDELTPSRCLRTDADGDVVSHIDDCGVSGDLILTQRTWAAFDEALPVTTRCLNVDSFPGAASESCNTIESRYAFSGTPTINLFSCEAEESLAGPPLDTGDSFTITLISEALGGTGDASIGSSLVFTEADFADGYEVKEISLSAITAQATGWLTVQWSATDTGVASRVNVRCMAFFRS